MDCNIKPLKLAINFVWSMCLKETSLNYRDCVDSLSDSNMLPFSKVVILDNEKLIDLLKDEHEIIRFKEKENRNWYLSARLIYHFKNGSEKIIFMGVELTKTLLNGCIQQLPYYSISMPSQYYLIEHILEESSHLIHCKSLPFLILSLCSFWCQVFGTLAATFSHFKYQIFAFFTTSFLEFLQPKMVTLVT